MNYSAPPPPIVMTAPISTNKTIEVKNYIEVEAEITAYTVSIKETGKTDGITASGAKVSRGMIAAPKSIPFDTMVEIDNVFYIVKDRGGAIKAKLTKPDWNGYQETIYHIDIYVPTREEAIRYGRQRKKIRVYGRK